MEGGDHPEASGSDADAMMEDADAGVGVLAPGRARAKLAARQDRHAQDEQRERGVASGGGGAAAGVPAGEPAGFEEVPLRQQNGHAGGGQGAEDTDSEDSDAGLAEMDPNSRAEARARSPPCSGPAATTPSS